MANLSQTDLDLVNFPSNDIQTKPVINNGIMFIAKGTFCPTFFGKCGPPMNVSLCFQDNMLVFEVSRYPMCCQTNGCFNPTIRWFNSDGINGIQRTSSRCSSSYLDILVECSR